MQTILPTAIRFGLDVTLKATLLLVLVFCLVAALGRASAAFRHLAAVLGLAGVLALPLVTLGVPRVAVPLVPRLLAELPAGPSGPAITPGTKAAALGSPIVTSNLTSVCPDAAAPSHPTWPLWAVSIWAGGALLASLRLWLGTLRL